MQAAVGKLFSMLGEDFPAWRLWGLLCSAVSLGNSLVPQELSLGLLMGPYGVG